MTYLLGEGKRQTIHGRLRSNIDGNGRHAKLGASRADLNDAATTRHMRHGALEEVQRAKDPDGKRLLNCLLGLQEGRPGSPPGCAVHCMDEKGRESAEPVPVYLNSSERLTDNINLAHTMTGECVLDQLFSLA